MPAIVYVGPHGTVNIPALGIDAEFGVPVEVDEGAAISLTAQSDWELAKPSKSSKSTQADTAEPKDESA